ncbi:MAG TPA: hypothetical protein VK211_24310 [Kamptonema sp.]|nr:hypothetical protein [Kamptonema sp.]
MRDGEIATIDSTSFYTNGVLIQCHESLTVNISRTANPEPALLTPRGGNYTEKIEGDFIQGNVISSTAKPAPQRTDLSKDGEVIDVEVAQEKEEKGGLAKFWDFFK